MPGDRGNQQLKEFTVVVDVEDNRKVKAKNVIDELEKTYGVGSIIAVVPRSGNLYEVTVSEKRYVDDLANVGFQVAGIKYACHAIYSSEKLVSFMHLPAFIDDNVIIQKLSDLGIETTSPFRRKKYPGTDVADGTRYVLCKFPPNVSSLPYTMKFEIDTNKHEYVRIKHDHQGKVCSVCLSDEHLYENCPYNVCYRCDQEGHLARNCPAEPCEYCYKFPKHCVCHEIEFGWTPPEEIRDNNDGTSDDETKVKREFARIGRERKRKQENVLGPQQQKLEKVDEQSTKSSDDTSNKENNGQNMEETVESSISETEKQSDEWMEVGRVPEIFPECKNVGQKSNLEEDSVQNERQKQNNNLSNSDVDINDDVLHVPLNMGPFSQEKYSHSNPGLNSDVSVGINQNKSDVSIENLSQTAHKTQTHERRPRLVNRPAKTPEELAKLRNTTQSKK